MEKNVLKNIVPDLGQMLSQLETLPSICHCDKRPGPVHAAVAVVLVECEGPCVLFIKKREHEGYDWSGHMAFPGGRIDKEDQSSFAAALRELEEEVGLPPESVEALGSLGCFSTLSKSLIVEAFPLLWRGTDKLVPLDSEMEWLSVEPLTPFINHHFKMGFNGKPHQKLGSELTYPLGKQTVWGLSARILHTLIERLQ
jgi:8-oxo-dGTP pyrophosphatase MutT (NUDIX family)